LSFTTTNPITTFAPESAGVTLGSPQLLGQAGFFFLRKKLLRAADVSAVYKEYTDTRGRPFLPVIEDQAANGLNLSGVFPSVAMTAPNLSMPSLSLCPSGSCTKTPTVRPAMPWLDWDTQYA
jgi:hypothetical protein